MNMPSSLRRAAFTGPRPEKLPPTASFADIEEALHRAILRSVEDGYGVFICGGCRGVDLWAARQVLLLRESYEIKLACFVPYRNQALHWHAADRALYQDVLNRANRVKILAERAYPGVYYDRNRAMLEHSDRLIAVSGPHTGGGTGHTVGLARQMGHHIVRIDPDSPLPQTTEPLAAPEQT